MCPKVLGFEKAGLLFKEHTSNKLYTISVEKSLTGEYYARDQVNYPSIGITGKFFKSKNQLTLTSH